MTGNRVFLIRLHKEKREMSGQQDIWRGQIENLKLTARSNEPADRASFQTLDRIITFIDDCVGEPTISIGAPRLLRLFAKRLLSSLKRRVAGAVK